MTDRMSVKCPWCGEEMRHYCWGIENETGFRCDNCNATAPVVTFRNDEYNTQEERYAVARKAAYQAAVRRPPNRALTNAEISLLDERDAVWCVWESAGLIGFYMRKGSTAKRGWPGPGYIGIWRRKPTQADIDAARGERE